jgi:hypothetical protein
MAWVEISEEDLDGVLSATERNAYRNHVAVVGEDGDPFPKVVKVVTKKVRGAIRSWRDNRLHPDANFIADECLDAAAVLVRHRLLTLIDEPISEPRVDEWKEANAFLKDVRAGKVAIEQPDEDPAAPQPPPAPVPLIAARRKQFGRDQQNGI